MPRTKEIFYFTLILSFFSPIWRWSYQVITIFDWYKNFAIYTHEISIWRHEQCRVIRIKHQIKYENVWWKFMHPCDWEVDR